MTFLSGTYPLIISHPWSFYMRVYFWSPYPSHITRSNCTYKIFIVLDVYEFYSSSLEEMLGDEPKANAESSGVLQPKVMTASELEELKKEAQVRDRPL
jgi:hypothetical protein